MIILILVIAIGIGYASVTKTLTINGKASLEGANDSNFNVKFTDFEVDSRCTAVISADGSSAGVGI